MNQRDRIANEFEVLAGKIRSGEIIVSDFQKTNIMEIGRGLIEQRGEITWTERYMT